MIIIYIRPSLSFRLEKKKVTRERGEMASKALQQMVTDFVEGVEIKTDRGGFRHIVDVFVASEAVDWLLDSGREE